ncbi:MAG: translation initiation factor IF-2 [Candidatus Aenigmatarchaeota archaeon]
MQEQLRQPIVTVLGHVDHGKTTLLDRIRQTAVAEREPGQITQCIGASQVPASVLQKLCGPLLKKFKFKITVPGLLFIDTPGHEAFTTLRRRGGAIADMAILVVDIAEGLKPQTIESLEILRAEKTPFVISVNKIDRIQGWRSKESAPFLESYEQQSDLTKSAFETAFYKVLEQISRYGFACDRYDRISDFTKTIAAVPTSGRTGEGVPDLLAVLTGLAQAFLREQIRLTELAQGSVLEVKETPGLGMTLDVILYDGILRRGDWLVVGGQKPQIAKIKALLMPAPMRELRIEKKFNQVDLATAACGVKIAAPGLEGVVAGSPIRATAEKSEAERMLKQFEHEREEVEISTETEGLILKADTIGSLEAMEVLFKAYPIKEATLGSPTREAVMHADANSDPLHRVLIAFNVPVSDEVRKLAKDRGIAILESNIIYHLIEEYQKWCAQRQEEMLRERLAGLPRPAKIRILPGYVFRASNPAIAGCEVAGVAKAGFQLFKPDRGRIGQVLQIQKEGKTVEQAATGERVAISIEGPTIGRQVDEGDVLYTDLTSEEYRKLKELSQFLSESERTVLQEIFELKRKSDPRFGL